MKVVLSWLREFAPIEGEPAEIADQLSALGLEVEDLIEVGAGLDGIVVARVLEVREHPNADKIRLVDVDRGDGEALQVACGASNMVSGDLVALATVGTVMPDGMEIAARKMRGEMSNGMLCSSRELGLGDDHTGIMILDAGLSLGTPIREALEIRHDWVFDIDVNPNRPDALSVLGVARDLAAWQGVPFAVPEPVVSESGAETSTLASVDVADTDLCGRFVARVISGVRLGRSPSWLCQRLLAAGMRPINNVVDVSNYVMLELGQPNHTYDLATLPGGAIGVRMARDGEVVETLDGVERRLSADDGVIVDGSDGVIGIAGVMGGATTEISDSTTDVLLELAWWNPEIIAAASTRLNVPSEASLRFKRGTDPTLPAFAARRFAELLNEISPGLTLHPGVIDVDHVGSREPVLVRTDKVNSVLGTDLGRDEIGDLIEPIGFTSTAVGDDLDVTIPPHRWFDCATEIDIIEEVARHYGYVNLGKSVPLSPHVGDLTPVQRARRQIRAALVGVGLTEALPMPFLAPGDLEACGLDPSGLVLTNPLAAEESVLRTSLRPGLLKAVAYNGRHRKPGVRFFEIGHVFGLGDRGVITDVERSSGAGVVLGGEAEHLGVVLAGSEAPATVALLEIVLASVDLGPLVLRAELLPGLHPGRAAAIEVSGVEVGAVGEVDPGVLAALDIDQRVAWLQLDLTKLLAIPSLVPQFRPISRFPSTDLDFAFVVDQDTTAAAVHTTIRAAGGDLVRAVDLFDVFRSDALGEGRRSLAFRVRFQAADRTLTDAEIANVRAGIISEVEAIHQATLRV